MQYASKSGLRVQERGGRIYVIDPRGGQRVFPDYEQAMRYYQKLQSTPQRSVQAMPVRKAADQEMPASTFEDDCARIGAECMRGKSSGRITILIPNKYAKQFDSEEGARMWLNEQAGNIGA